MNEINKCPICGRTLWYDGFYNLYCFICMYNEEIEIDQTRIKDGNAD